MTFAEAVKEIRSVTRVCLGNYVAPDADRLAMKEELEGHINSDDQEAAEQMVRAIEVERGEIQKPLGGWAGTTTKALELIFAKQLNCGQDFNDIIVGNPWDGKIYTYVCPQCGRTGEYQAPTYILE